MTLRLPASTRLPLPTAIAGLLLTAPVFGAEPQTLGGIRVAEDVIPEDTYTAPSAATATGLELSLRETPQSVSVVTRERMDDQAMTTVADALLNTAGVSLKPVDRGRNNLSVRGFDVNNFQLDGIPVATGNIGIETADTAMYERIEVVRGATGLLSGAGDPSAAINLVRKHADSQELTTSFSVEAGTWHRRAGTIDVQSALNGSGSVRGRLVASYREQDAFIDLEETSRTLFYGVVDADLGENTRLSVGGSRQSDKRDGVLWAGLPYYFSDGTRAIWDRSKTTATDWNQWDTVDEQAFVTLEHGFGNGWSIRADAMYHHQNEDSLLLWVWGDPDPVTGEGMETYAYHYISPPQQIHGDLVLSGSYAAFGREQELIVGLMHSKLESEWTNADPVDGGMPLGNFYTWDGSFAQPEMGERYLGSRTTVTQSALYAVTRLQVTDPLKFVLGGRISNWKSQDDAGVWTSAAYEVKHSSVFTPFAGVIYDLSEVVSLYASYTDSFKPQTDKDRNGRYLDPEVGNSYELGVKGELLDGRVNASAAVFRIDQDNYAVVDVGFFVPGTLDPAYRTSQGVTSEGYEVEVSGALTDHWTLTASWTDFSAKDADNVDVAVDHSRELLRVFTKVHLAGALSPFSIGAGFNWEGDRPALATNPGTGEIEKVGQPAYSLVDLMVEWQLRDEMSLQVNINNALDKTYRSGSYWWGSPYTYGDPREVVISVDVAF